MNSPGWRAKTASAMVAAIDAFFAASATPGVAAAADSGVAIEKRPANAPDH